MESAEGEDICPICREKISNSTTLDCCQHKYDLHCLQRWLVVSNLCPLCVKPINRFEDNTGLVDHTDSYLHRSLNQLRTVLDRSQAESSEFEPQKELKDASPEEEESYESAVSEESDSSFSSEGMLSDSSSFELSDDSSGPPRKRTPRKNKKTTRDLSPKRKQPSRSKRRTSKG